MANKAITYSQVLLHQSFLNSFRNIFDYIWLKLLRQMALNDELEIASNVDEIESQKQGRWEDR